MEEQWLLINYQELLKSLLNGDRGIQEPISIMNMRRDKSSKVSFLNLLLSYQNINKDNILEILSDIHSRFTTRIEGLKGNRTVQLMMDRINNEWYDPDFIFSVKNPIPNDFFTVNSYNKKHYDSSCKVCDEIKQLSKIENNIPLGLKEGEKHPLENHIDRSIHICDQSIQYIEDNCKNIQSIIHYLKSVNMEQFVDLSIKHKSLYLTLSEVNEDDEIPENIHRIFSNYIHIHNLLLKQMTQYYHYLNHLLNAIKGECKGVKDMKQNINTIAYMYDNDNSNEDDPVSDMIDYEEDHSLIDERVNREQEVKGGDILSKISSFF